MSATQDQRAGGVLLHPTSLPGPQGIGDLGPEAHAWVDWLAACGCRLWQVLPLGPTGYADSPYQSYSAFAGNPLLISLHLLAEEGLLREEELQPAPDLPGESVDYSRVRDYKQPRLALAAERFFAGSAPHLKQAYEAFRHEQAHWLEDYALFMALKEPQRGAAWVEWDPALARRDADALRKSMASLVSRMDDHRFQQFIFFRQWRHLREHAAERGMRIIGDVPIFVAHDSADVWAHPELLKLDERGYPAVVAGVPPDYFSSTGQRWGNPVYRWEAHRQQGYAWWIARMRSALAAVDLVRLDHFRGFEAAWEIPAAAPTAEEGEWAPGPGGPFFEALRAALGELPLIAEDLGIITPAVEALRDGFELPGMKVLQFAFGGGADNPYLPHNYPHRCAVYTGTHDNDTTRGWFESAPQAERSFCLRYLGSTPQAVVWDMIRAAWSSVASLALAPMQDLLGLGSEARMNLPGRIEGNWRWRMRREALSEELAGAMRELHGLYGR